ncbi:GAF domain-containing protein [Streptomyces sp. NPDC056738]|uniref:GAF domain-containing protein n=1 Tax=Streptomyces sp. NPDC056738 TaxID=3345933 RepID=UPI003676E5F1
MRPGGAVGPPDDHQGRRVIRIFDEASRETILHAGSRAAHSLPVTSPTGQVIGMISSHHEQPPAGFTPTQLAALEATGTMVRTVTQTARFPPAGTGEGRPVLPPSTTRRLPCLT